MIKSDDPNSGLDNSCCGRNLARLLGVTVVDDLDRLDPTVMLSRQWVTSGNVSSTQPFDVAHDLAERPLRRRQALQDGRQREDHHPPADGMNACSAASNHNKSLYSSFGYYGAGRLTDPGGANPTSSIAARAQMDAKTLSACGNAKAAGVTVYPVGFSVSIDPIDAAGLGLPKKCATSPQMAYVANDSSTIITVFEDIAKKFGGLRLTQ